MERVFENRAEAGRQLAEKLDKYAGRDDVIVLGLPRGGVPVAYEVAKRLHAPLDVFIVRKLGVPGFEELAAGAIASGGVRVLNRDVVASLDIPEHVVDSVAASELRELEEEADETICLSTPPFFQAVGQYYEDFSQTSDDDVRELLSSAAQNISGDQQ